MGETLCQYSIHVTILSNKMSTYNGKPYSTPRNIDLKGGILRFHATNATNPLGDETYGLYVNSSGELIFRSTTSSTTLGAAGGGSTAPSLDAIYAGDQNLAITAGSLTMAGSHVSNDVITVTATGSGDCIQITNAGTGNDIEGTSDTWHFSKAGDFTANMGVMAGDAGSNSLTLTAGDVLISDGCIALTDNTTAGTALSVTSGVTTTNGRGILLVANALTTGVGFGFAHTTTVIADGGSMMRLSSSGVDTGGTTNGTILDIASTGSVAGTLVKIYSNVASQTATCLLDIAAAGYTTGYTGSLVKMTGVSTTGAGSVLTVTGANTTAGNTVKIDAAAVTTGTGLLVTSAGVIITTGELVSLVANGATTCTGVVRASATSLTDGWVMELTGASGDTATSSGGVLHLVGAGATDGSLLRVTASGAYDSTSGIVNIIANAATTGNVMTISATALTTGSALEITANTTATGEYINCYDGANIDFKVSRYGAVTIAGNAVGTAALTVTAGDLVLTAGTAIYREKTEVVTTTNTIGAAESGTTFYLNSAGGFTSTLPAPAAGLHFKFVVKTAPTTSYIITTNAAANVLYGKIFERAGTAGVAGAAADVINFVANNAIAGDTYLFDCDGTNWYITGSVDVAAGCTFATD